MLAALPVYLSIYAFVHFCPLSVYACFAPSYMPGSYSHIYLFSIATHHALWFSVAIIASQHSTHTPTNNLNQRLEHVLNLNTPCLGIEIFSARPSSLLFRPLPIPRRPRHQVIITLFNRCWHRLNFNGLASIVEHRPLLTRRTRFTHYSGLTNPISYQAHSELLSSLGQLAILGPYSPINLILTSSAFSHG